MKTLHLNDFKDVLTKEEMLVLKDMFGDKEIPVSSAKNGQTLAKAILADMESDEVEA